MKQLRSRNLQINTQRGYSLITLLVALSLSGIVTVVTLRQFSHLESGKSSLKIRQDLLSIRNTILQQLDCTETLKGHSSGSTSCVSQTLPLLNANRDVLNPTQGAAYGGMIGRYNIIGRCNAAGSAIEITWRMPGYTDQISGKSLDNEQYLFGENFNFCSTFFHPATIPPAISCFTLSQTRNPATEGNVPKPVDIQGVNQLLEEGKEYRTLQPETFTSDSGSIQTRWGLECGADYRRVGCTAKSETNAPSDKDIFFTDNGCQVGTSQIPKSNGVHHVTFTLFTICCRVEYNL